jgi:hypothetical protein
MRIVTVIHATACKFGIFFATTFCAVAVFMMIQGVAADSAKTALTIALLLGGVILIRKPLSYGWLRHRAFYLGILFALPVLWVESESAVQRPPKKDAVIAPMHPDNNDKNGISGASHHKETVEKPSHNIDYKEFYLPPEYARYMPLLRAGAVKVFEQASCDRIEYADFSATKSTKQQPVFYYTCRKGSVPTNIFVSLKELQDADFTLPVAIDVGAAKERCEQYIKAQLNFPSTFDSGLFNWSTREWPNGNREILIEFTAKNAFNLELPSTATCLFTPNPKGGYEMEGNIFKR